MLGRCADWKQAAIPRWAALSTSADNGAISDYRVEKETNQTAEGSHDQVHHSQWHSNCDGGFPVSCQGGAARGPGSFIYKVTWTPLLPVISLELLFRIHNTPLILTSHLQRGLEAKYGKLSQRNDCARDAL